VRHAESEGNIDNFAYTSVPDPQVPLVSHCDASMSRVRKSTGKLSNYCMQDSQLTSMG
jgi:hypothetical protein